MLIKRFSETPTMLLNGTAISFRKLEIYKRVESIRTFFRPAQHRRISTVPITHTAKNCHLISGGGAEPFLPCRMSSHNVSVPNPKPEIHAAGKTTFIRNV